MSTVRTLVVIGAFLLIAAYCIGLAVYGELF